MTVMPGLRQFVSLVSKGGSPVMLADAFGTPYPTTGQGSLVFNENPELWDPILHGFVNIEDGMHMPAGSAASPPITFGPPPFNSGIYSPGAGEIGIAVNGLPVMTVGADGISVTGDITYSGVLLGAFHTPLVTRGDLYYMGAGGPTRLGIGAAGTTPVSNGTDLVYQPAATGNITSLTGTAGIVATPDPITTTGSFSLADTTVVPGTYGSATNVPQILVDQKGRLLSVTNIPLAPAGGTVTSVGAGTGLAATPSPIIGAGTIRLADTAVVPATYGSTSNIPRITIDQQGRITSATDVAVTIPPAGVTSISTSGGSGITLSPSPIVATGSIVVDTSVIATRSFVASGFLPLSGGTVTGTILNQPAAPITASAPALAVLQTWNNVAVTFNALSMNITDTASNVSSRLLSLQVGSADRLSLDKFGNVILAGALNATIGTFSSSVVSTGGVVRAGNPPTTGYALLNPGSASTTGYVAFFKADGTRVGYIGLYENRIGYTADVAGSFHQFIGPGAVEWARISGAATSATFQLGVNTEIGIIQLDASGTMYVRSQKAGTFTWLGGGGGNAAFVGPTGIYPSPTNTQGLGNANNTWAAVYANAFVANGVAGTNRTTFYDTAGVHRWGTRAGAGAESGSNAGSDFTIDRYSDAGTYIDSPFLITRATSAAQLTGTLTISAPVTANVPSVTYGNIDGNFYHHIANTNAGVAAASGYGMELSSIANGYALLLLNKGGGVPNLQLSLGAGITGGFTVSPPTTFSSNVASTSVGITPPASPLDRQLWWNNDNAAGGGQLFIRYNDGNTTQWVPAAPAVGTNAPFMRNSIAGFVHSHPGATQSLTVGPGQASDSTNTAGITSGGNFTKTLAAFVAGSGNGGMGPGLTVAINTFYYPFAATINGAFDIFFDNTAIPTHIPTGTTAYRRLRAIKTDGSSNIIAHTGKGDYVYWNTATTDLNTFPAGLFGVNVPPGINVLWLGSASISAAAGNRVDMVSGDFGLAGILSFAWTTGGGGTATIVSAGAQASVWTNTSQQVYCTSSGSGNACSISTRGWIDDCGRYD